MVRQPRTISTRSRRTAFTMVELLLVIIIMGVLISLLMGGGIMAKNSARIRHARSMLSALSAIATEYEAVTGVQYPGTSLEDFVAAAKQLPEANLMLWSLNRDFYDGTTVIDPWGEPIRYAMSNDHGLPTGLRELPEHRTPFFVSIGPDQQIGSYHENASEQDREAAKDNLHSFEVQ